MLTDEQMQAVLMVREEADKLRLACIASVGTGALLHLAYDGTVEEQLPLNQALLVGWLRGVE